MRWRHSRVVEVLRMCGRRNAQASMLAFVDLENAFRRTTVAHRQELCRSRAGRPVAEVRCDVRKWRAAVDPAPAAAAGHSADQLVLGAQRARLLRRTRLPTALTVVPRADKSSSWLRSRQRLS